MKNRTNTSSVYNPPPLPPAFRIFSSLSFPPHPAISIFSKWSTIFNYAGLKGRGSGYIRDYSFAATALPRLIVWVIRIPRSPTSVAGLRFAMLYIATIRVASSGVSRTLPPRHIKNPRGLEDESREALGGDGGEGG